MSNPQPPIPSNIRHIQFIDLKYLATFLYKVSPLFLITYFVFSSIFNADVRSMYFLGLLFFNFIIVLILGNALKSILQMTGIFNILRIDINSYMDKQDELIPMSGEKIFGIIPIRLEIFVYTLGYFSSLLYDNALLQNVSAGIILFFLSSLSFAHFVDLFWWKGVPIIFLIITIGVGLVSGHFAYQLSRAESVRMFTNLTGTEVCRRANQQSFKCKPKYVM